MGNFDLFEVAGHGSETQLQMGENQNLAISGLMDSVADISQWSPTARIQPDGQMLAPYKWCIWHLKSHI